MFLKVDLILVFFLYDFVSNVVVFFIKGFFLNVYFLVKIERKFVIMNICVGYGV